MAGASDRGFSFEQRRSDFGRTSQGTGTPGGQQGEAGVMDTIKETAQNLAETVSSTAGDAWESTRQGAQQLASTVADTTTETVENITRFIRKYPVPSLLGACGVGFLLGGVVASLLAHDNRRW